MNETIETTRYTTEPWKVIQPDASRPSRAIVSGHSGVDIYNAPLTNETQANARLIAAAPDLLAACEFVAKYAAMREGKGDPLPEQLTRAVQAAITKATAD